MGTWRNDIRLILSHKHGAVACNGVPKLELAEPDKKIENL